jgi:hypothetical protein
MRFMAPHGPWPRLWRWLVLRLAPRSAWFRRHVNSGRLAEPAVYSASGPDDSSPVRHGTVAPDVPLPDGGRLRDRLGGGFALVVAQSVGRELPLPEVVIGSGTVYGDDRAWLIRPDGYVASSAPPSDVDALWISRHAAGDFVDKRA